MSSIASIGQASQFTRSASVSPQSEASESSAAEAKETTAQEAVESATGAKSAPPRGTAQVYDIRA